MKYTMQQYITRRDNMAFEMKVLPSENSVLHISI